jgi:hypothetical protein
MNDIFEHAESIIREIEQERGSFTFAGMIAREDSGGGYDLVVAAPWIDEHHDFFRYIQPKLSHWFTKSDWQKFGHVAITEPDGEFVRDFSRLSGPITREKSFYNLRVANIDVRNARIFPTPTANYSYAGN